MGRRKSTLVELGALANVVQTAFVKLPTAKQENQVNAKAWKNT